MKNLLFILLLSLPIASFSQKNDYNEKDGFVAKGYDVVAYFSGKATVGISKFTYEYQGAKFKFSTKTNLDTFKANPQKYIPQYGGYCAYAMGKDGSKVNINPKTFEIRDGKLFLFYNAFGINTLKKWNNENPNQLKKQADKHWAERD